MICSIKGCGQESNTSIVCKFHQKYMSDFVARNMMRKWHDQVCAKGYDEEKDHYSCFHCGYFFTRQEVCGDHWPETKGSQPAKKFDVTAGVCSCKPCNTSGNKNRTPVPKYV